MRLGANDEDGDDSACKSDSDSGCHLLKMSVDTTWDPYWLLLTHLTGEETEAWGSYMI